MADLSAIVTNLTPLVISLIEQYRHLHSDVPVTEDAVKTALLAHLQAAETKGERWLVFHPSLPTTAP